MILGIVVTLPFCSRPVCLPVLARLAVKDTTSASRLYLARRMIGMLAGALPGRVIHGVGDAAYSGKDLAGLDDSITWTTRLRKDAALSGLAPPPTGKRGRPKLKGGRLPALKILAARAALRPCTGHHRSGRHRSGRHRRPGHRTLCRPMVH
ncbi:MAG: hypothetical protein ACLP52_29500 [Streptosporangiaceae bacterium]